MRHHNPRTDPSSSTPNPSSSLLPTTSEHAPTQTLRPPLLRLLLIQPRIAPLGSVYTFLANPFADGCQEAAFRELAANAFCDAVLNGIDVFVAGDVRAKFI